MDGIPVKPQAFGPLTAKGEEMITEICDKVFGRERTRFIFKPIYGKVDGKFKGAIIKVPASMGDDLNRHGDWFDDFDCADAVMRVELERLNAVK